MKKVLSLILIVVMVLSLGSATFAASGKWVKYNGKYYYQKEDGSYCVSEWKQLDGKYYYFGSNGVVVTGWQKISGHYYYFGSNAALVTGPQKINGKWYSLGPYVTTGFISINGKLYYFGSDGAMVTGAGVRTINGKVYYFTGDSSIYTGWLQYGSDWYYFKENGAMAMNETVIGYKFAANGKCTGKANATDSLGITAYVSDNTKFSSLKVRIDPATFQSAKASDVVTIEGTWQNNTRYYHTMFANFQAQPLTASDITYAIATYPSQWKAQATQWELENAPLVSSFSSGFPKVADFDTSSKYYVLALNLDKQYNYISYVIFTITK